MKTIKIKRGELLVLPSLSKHFVGKFSVFKSFERFKYSIINGFLVYRHITSAFTKCNFISKQRKQINQIPSIFISDFHFHHPLSIKVLLLKLYQYLETYRMSGCLSKLLASSKKFLKLFCEKWQKAVNLKVVMPKYYYLTTTGLNINYMTL